jgi:hypothetical protein
MIPPILFAQGIQGRDLPPIPACDLLLIGFQLPQTFPGCLDFLFQLHSRHTLPPDIEETESTIPVFAPCWVSASSQTAHTPSPCTARSPTRLSSEVNDLIAVTFRTRSGALFLREIAFPEGAAAQTPITVLFEYDVSSFYSNRFSLCESFRHFSVGALHDTSAGSSRNAHAFGCLLLIQPIFIHKPDCLVLVHGKGLLLKLNHWNALGLEVDYRWRILDPSVLLGFGHEPIPFLRIFSPKV